MFNLRNVDRSRPMPNLLKPNPRHDTDLCSRTKPGCNNNRIVRRVQRLVSRSWRPYKTTGRSRPSSAHNQRLIRKTKKRFLRRSYHSHQPNSRRRLNRIIYKQGHYRIGLTNSSKSNPLSHGHPSRRRPGIHRQTNPLPKFPRPLPDLIFI